MTCCCCCRLLDDQRDRCVPGEHVVGGHTHRAVRASRDSLASPVSAVADSLGARRAARRRSGRSDAPRRTLSPTSSGHQRVQLPAGSGQGVSVHREVGRTRPAAALPRQDEGPRSSEGRRRGAEPTARLLPAVQPTVLPGCRR